MKAPPDRASASLPLFSQPLRTEPAITAPTNLSTSHALRIVIATNPMEVRRALERVVGDLSPIVLPPEASGSVELVLAEVLNNVVEHGYPDEANGVMELSILQNPDGLHCTVFDDGMPMPDLTPPEGHEARVDVPLDSLPEGGFGWFLIRELSRDLRYERVDGRNRLSFSLSLLP